MSKWLLSHILGRLVLLLSKNHLLELKRDLFFVKHHGNTFRGGRERGAVELKDHDEWDVKERFCELSWIYVLVHVSGVRERWLKEQSKWQRWYVTWHWYILSTSNCYSVSIHIMIGSFPFTFTFSVPGLPNPFYSGYSRHFRPSSCPQVLQVSREYLDIQNGKLSGDRSTALPTSSFSSPPSRPKNLKRGWDSELTETIDSQSSIATSGYHSPPSKEFVGVSDVHNEGVLYFVC